MKPETIIQSKILAALGGRTDCRMFRNTVGTVQDKRTGHWITFGLMVGSADLIGWRTITVTPEMVGRKLAVFTSIEVKTASGKSRGNQTTWSNNVLKAGGIAGEARSEEMAVKLIENV